MPSEQSPGRVLSRCARVLLCLTPVVASCRRAPGPPPPPDYNVVLISVDTLRADRLNCYGYRARETSPNIDALARDAILFENHVSSSPWTTPAHMSLLTSLYPSAHGLTQSFRDLITNLVQGGEFNKLPESRTTLAEVLRDQGYTTGAFTAGAAVDPKIGFGQGFTAYDTSMYKLSEENMAEMFGWLTRNSIGRFFLFWHNFEVHAPYLQTDFLDEVLPAARAAQLRPALGTLAEELSQFNPDANQRQQYRERVTMLLNRYNAFNRVVCEALYCGGIRSVDEWIGRFMQELRDRGLYDRTLIVFTSDHGEEFGNHIETRFYGGHGHTLYEEVVRVPLIIKLPEQEFAGTRVTEVVRIVDVMPTILDVLSINPVPNEMQGTSLRPLWEGRRQEDRRAAVSESLAASHEKKGIRLGRYKYIATINAETVQEHGRRYIPEEPSRRELYDLQADPDENVNLLESPGSEEAADLAKALELRLRQFVAEQTGETEKVLLDQETIDRLRALGYIGGNEASRGEDKPEGKR